MVNINTGQLRCFLFGICILLFFQNKLKDNSPYTERGCHYLDVWFHCHSKHFLNERRYRYTFANYSPMMMMYHLLWRLHTADTAHRAYVFWMVWPAMVLIELMLHLRPLRRFVFCLTIISVKISYSICEDKATITVICWCIKFEMLFFCLANASHTNAGCVLLNDKWDKFISV